MKKNRIKIFTFLFLSAIEFPTFAQGIIYKCTDLNGDVSYTTEISNKNCEKTNLAKIDKGNIMNKPSIVTNSSTLSVPNVNITVGNSDQIVRDQKRTIILQGELSQEKNQLKTVLEMIAKVDKGDLNQIEQLKKMEQTHKRNIASLEKELGIGGNSKVISNKIPSGLPFSLPKEANEVQLVETPQMNKNLPQYAPKNPYLMVNPSSMIKPPVNKNNTVLNPPNPQVSINPPIQNIKPAIIKEYRQPAAITNKSIKNKIAPTSNN